ncbi:energy transducer TonB [Hymenobacter baengnokdamensis]|uniref:energy transducer TonB n=1 Tax=Hymenobacter baengnokdamensis TaxID=2615203 RepID=UPI0012484E26|nr:energy transducer TonB [Hymenobacter baengnokdamensis]
MLPTNPLLNATAPAGAHLPVALLRQYAAGSLAPAAQHRVEAHTLACQRCADILDGLLQTPPATTDQALQQLQQRLRKRVLQQAAPARQQLGSRQHRWLAPQLAAAATLLLGLVAGGWWTWQQRYLTPGQPVTERNGPVATTPAPAARVAPTVATGVPPAEPISSTVATAVVAVPAARHPAAQGRHRAGIYKKEDVLARRQPAESQPLASEAVAAAPTQAPALAVAPADTATLAMHTRRLAVAKANPASEPALVHDAAMPAGPRVLPVPAGGYPALREKLRHDAASFQPETPEPKLTGTVKLSLTIGADGKIQQVSVLHGLRADYDAEAQRLVCEGPAWIPGISSGRRAAQVVEVTVPF